MIILPDKIIIQIPKTGCMSRMSEYGINPWFKINDKCNAVTYYDAGDAPLPSIHTPYHLIPKKYSHLPTYTYVRNPWNRTVSRYYYSKKYYKINVTFEEFINKQYISEEHKTYHWGPPSWKQQTDWIGNNTICYKFEECNFKYHLMSSNITNYNNEYTRKLIDLVGDYYQNDIIKFNYLPEKV